MNLKEKAQAAMDSIPALWLAMKRSDTPRSAKVLAALTVGYALSPIDLIPDFIPVLGYLDDLVILPLLTALTIRRIPPEILNECREQAQQLRSGGARSRWFYAVPVILCWIALAVWLISKWLG
ncbi:hypothetical protein DSECCO2_279240 [anaerobic digester metagenome]|nr:YkvA family protein [Clostridiaceae bacterium HFYG-1003]